MENYINKNAIYKELVRKHGKQWSYTKIESAFKGKAGTLSAAEKSQLIQVIDLEVKKIKDNIKLS
jgi:hypothetical protein